MYEFIAADAETARRMYEAGDPPSAIARHLLLLRDNVGPLDLYDIMHVAFGADYSDLHCLNGWWHDGTGELSDAQIDSFLHPAIAKGLADGAKCRCSAHESIQAY